MNWHFKTLDNLKSMPTRQVLLRFHPPKEAGAMRTKPNNERTVTMFDNIIGKFCVIRTHSAGVHTGVVENVSADGKIVTLRDARRIWRWRGANTLNEIALRGVHLTEHTRISEPVNRLTVTECIEKIGRASCRERV